MHYWRFSLLPLTLLYALVISLRKLTYQMGILKSKKVKSPVIIVGNIEVGGTGKTPFTQALVHLLQKEGFKPGIALRGYKATPPQKPFYVTAKTPVKQAGDEALLHASNLSVPVVIDTNRVRAAQCLTDKHHCNVIVCDDGLQHLALQRDIEIALTPVGKNFLDNFLLPVGRLRERKKRLNKVDFIVTKNTPDFTLQPECFVSCHDEHHILPLDYFKGTTVHAIAAIGRPQQFFNSLKNLGCFVTPHPKRDHKALDKNDLTFYDTSPIIITEKDALKLTHPIPNNTWYLKVTPCIAPALFARILAKLKEKIRG